MGIERLEVPPEQLTKVCDPDELGFETTEELEPLEGTIGQERAISALELGLDLEEAGFNLFVSGIPGTGRNTALRTYVGRIANTKPIPPDWGYVYNFEEPSQPVALSLPCGMMRILKQDMEELVGICRREIPRAFESEEYGRRMEEAMRSFETKRQAIADEMERAAREVGFALRSTPIGITPVPLQDGSPMSAEAFGALDAAEQEKLRHRGDEVQRAIARTAVETRRLNKEATAQAREVDKEVVRFTLSPIVDELQSKYAEYRDVVDYLDRVESDMVDHLDVFKPKDEPPLALGPLQSSEEEDTLIRYRVNDLVDNATCVAAPVIFEDSPTYYNLFGRIDYQARVGTFTTDLTMIKAGSIHRANGGYLVVQAKDLLTSPLSWETLKRTLRSGEIRVENIGEQQSPLPSTTLRPQPIPVNIKAIVVGIPQVLNLLQSADDDFRRFFKVVADFDTRMDRTPVNMSKYAAFVKARCRDSDLMPLHKTAVARVIDYSSRLVGHQDKLTTRFMHISEILTEANYWAGKDGSTTVTGEHVKKAIDQRQYRASLTEDRLRELIEDGTIRIAIEGETVGHVNGLAVIGMGDYAFGKPSRITARVSVGRGQVINVDRETRMSGKIHNKGFMILTGYLKGKYGRDRPLSLSASIGFEQTYSQVEGDSASSTELYALLSELSGLPIAQGIAVTGSVNQTGDVQAIGGATEKVEGFFDLCKAKSLNGRQGVLVPKDNLKNLVLNDETIEAVRDGRFHVYGASTIDEGIEVLTGVPAGELREDGTYPAGTVHERVERRLAEMANKAKESGRGQDRNENRKDEEKDDGTDEERSDD